MYKKCVQHVENTAENYVRLFPQFLGSLLKTTLRPKVFRHLAAFTQLHAQRASHVLHIALLQNQSVAKQLSTLYTRLTITTTMYINKEGIL